MISGILCGPESELMSVVGRALRACIHRFAGETSKWLVCPDTATLKVALSSREVWDMACVDIGAGQGMELVRMLRESCSSVELLLIVDENTPPMSYVRPGVMPSGLIQRGALTNAVLQSIEDFVSHALVGIRGREDVDCFVLETKEELLRIPYASILCFESRSKRISVRLQRNEYAYYDTLDRLQQSLPSSFVRCHRSFIVNMSRVLELQLSKNHIRMDDNTIVPVSRSYKSAMRERFA